MIKTLIKGGAIACLFGGAALAGPVYVMAAEDMETEAVQKNMRPDVTTPGSQDEEEASKGEAMNPAEDQKDIGEEEIEKDMGAPK